MSRRDTIWQDAHVAGGFLGVRTAFPYALDHPRFVLDLLSTGRPVKRFLDVGCGGGFFTAAVHRVWPDAEAVMVDFSQAMLDEVDANVTGPHRTFVRDLMEPGWCGGLGPVDAVVSGFAIHHLPDERKRAIYRDLFELLRPGGWFVHVEHVASASPLGTMLFDRQVTDALHAHLQASDPTATRDDVAKHFDDRVDAEANILSPVDTQCGWLREVGFADVDCFFKCYEVAVFGGRKPEGD